MTRRQIVAAAALVLLLAACGTRLPEAEIAAAARGDGSAIVSDSPSSATEQDDGLAVDAGEPDPSSRVEGDAGVTSAGGERAGVATGGGPTAGPAQGKTAGSVIKLGNVGQYGGVVGAAEGAAQPMIQVWAKSVNARGGINGHPVEVITADDGGDPSRNLALVRDMVENHKVIAFVGNFAPLSIDGSRRYLEEKRIPVVGGDLTTHTWHQSPMLFPQGTSLTNGNLAVAKLAVSLKKPKMALLYCAEAAGCQSTKKALVDDGGAEKQGAEVVYSSQISLAQPDFTAECLQAQRAGAQVMYMAAGGDAAVRAANNCTSQGYRVTFLGSALGFTDDMAANRNLEGSQIVSYDFPWTLDSGPAAEYADALRRYAPNLKPAGATAYAWTAGKLLEKAAAVVSANPTSQEILEGLWSLKNETLGGLAPPLTFVRDKPAPEANCFFTVTIKGGRFTSDTGLTTLCV